MDNPSRSPEIIILLLFLTLVLLSLIGAGIGYLYFGATLSEVRIILLGIGIMANLLLVSAYVLTLIQNRRMDIREREKPLKKDVLSQVIQPAITAMDENRKRLFTPELSTFPGRLFTFKFFFDEEEYLRRYLQQPIFVNESQPQKRFLQDETELIEMMDQHDELLFDFLKLEYRLKTDLVECIIREVGYENAESVDVGEISVILLRGFAPGEDHSEYDFWKENQNEIEEVVFELRYETQIYRKYSRMRREYSNFTEDLETELKKYEENIQRSYGISSPR